MMLAKTLRIVVPERLTVTHATPGLGRPGLGRFGWACLLIGLTGLACSSDDHGGGAVSGDPRLVEPRGLLGTGPVDNYFAVPKVKLEDAGSWRSGMIIQGLKAMDFYFPDNPTRDRGLAVQPETEEAVLMLPMQTTGSMEVSVWLGSTSPATPQVGVSVVGIAPSHAGPMSADLVPDPSTRRTTNNIHWQRYQVTVSGLAGFAWLGIAPQGALLVTGPVARSLKSAGPSAPLRALNPAEEAAMRLVAQDTRDRFRAPQDDTFRSSAPAANWVIELSTLPAGIHEPFPLHLPLRASPPPAWAAARPARGAVAGGGGARSGLFPP